MPIVTHHRLRLGPAVSHGLRRCVPARMLRLSLRLRLFLFLLLLGGVTGCGKRGYPLPPVERIPQRTELLSGIQRGNQVLLSWPAPRRTAGPGSVQSIERIDVYRLTERSDAPLPLTIEDFATRATLIGSLDAATLQKSPKGPGNTLTYTDTLSFGTAPARLRYALRYVNSAGQRAAFSNFLLLEPAARVAQPPVLNTVRESEYALTLGWTPPTANVDGSQELTLAGYNIYRSGAGQNEKEAAPLNGPVPFNGTEFADKDFRFNEQYVYLVRAVSLGTNGQPVESLNSNTLTVLAADRYAPTAPANISLAVSPNGKAIALFFPANPERDVAGYNLYRTTNAQQPLAQWTKLNNDLLTRTTYRDEQVMSGQTYYYYLIAVDTAGNLSPPSPLVSDTVP